MFKQSALYLRLGHYARISLALVLFLGGGATAYAKPPGSRSVPSIRAPQLLALDGGVLLAWTAVGEAQLRTAEGTWLPAFRMPMRDVLHVINRGNGFLALGLPNPKEPTATFPVVAYDNAGKEAGRWSVPSSWSLAANGTDAWAITTQEALLPLLPGGGLGSPMPVPLWRDQPPRDPRFAASPLRWQRFEWGDAIVYCHDADLTKQGYVSARCHREGAAGWAYTFGDPQGGRVVAACGAWLVAQAGRPVVQLTVIDMLSGQVTAQRTYKDAPVVQCAGRDELLVGLGRRMELLALPDLAVRWRSPRLPGAVAAVAAGEREIVYRLGAAPDILSMPRPHGD